MHCLDSTFLIDAAKGRPGAQAKAIALEDAGERVVVPAPVIAEVLMGAHFQGGTHLRKMLELLASLEVLDTTADIAQDAGLIGADMMKRGNPTGTIDLIIAATARRSGAILLTRVSVFGRIPGLAVESY